MSGPKCIEIRRVPLAQARRMNREFCRTKLAWLEHIDGELEELQRRLDQVGLESLAAIPDARRLAADLEPLLREGDGFQATQHCMAAAAAAEQTLSTGQERLRERLAELHRRFRELEEGRQRIVSDRESLAKLIGSVVPVDWPEAERTRFEQTAAPVLEQVAVPDATGPELTRENISRLERAEAEVAANLRLLTEGHEKLVGLLNATHARLLTERLVPTSSNLQTLGEYLRTHAKPEPDAAASSPPAAKVAAKLDGLLSDIMVLEHTATWGEILRRAQVIRQETDTIRQRMLYDALVIECSGHLKHLRVAERFRREIHGLLDAAVPWKGTCVDAVVQELLALERAAVVVDLCEVENRLDAAIDEARKQLEREEKRRAVLQALAEMGYTARDGMETALVREGKCILRRAGDEDYGVQVSVDRDLAMVETEIVRFVADERDRPTRQQELADARREEAWCEDYKRARELLAAKYGWQADLRYQLNPGQQPVKRVVDEGKRKATRTDAQSEKSRSPRARQTSGS